MSAAPGIACVRPAYVSARQPALLPRAQTGGEGGGNLGRPQVIGLQDIAELMEAA